MGVHHDPSSEANMLIEKEVIRPGTYWYRDEATKLPRKLVVTPDLARYWAEQGNAMLAAGLTVPVPYEHDFNSHPMTPADKLINNAGWVKEYRLKGENGDRLFSVVDVQDESVAKKLPNTIRWTSPWISTFTDGRGKKWENVISHLALTSRPRVIDQEPFGSVAAALSMAADFDIRCATDAAAQAGFCLTRAGRLAVRKSDRRLIPRYPVAFSMLTGAALGEFPPPKGAKAPPTDDSPPDDDDESDDDAAEMEGVDDEELEPGASPDDVQMEELLCDLLGALGIKCEQGGDEATFKRNLYNAAMTEIHNLTGKAKAEGDKVRTNPPGQPPNNPKPGAGQPNPLIQQEQQPMFMSLEEINRLPDPMRGVALAMYTENQKLRGEMEASKKVTDSLRDAKLKEASVARAARVALLGKMSPRAKAELDAMVASPAMALSMGEGGTVVDPMAQTLSVLEKGLSGLPRLLTTDVAALSVQPQPQDSDVLSDQRADEIADGLARQMGCPPNKKAAG